MPGQADVTQTQHTAAAVIVAAGSSSRLGGKVRKPYLELQGKTVLTWSAAALARLKSLRQIVVVTRPEDRAIAQASLAAAHLPQSIALACVDGGARRQDSVCNGLKATLECDVVLIHDAARPFPPLEAMEAACRQALTCGAAILAIPVKDTVKRQVPAAAETGAQIEATVPRNGLWLAQTPQVFRRRLILELNERLARESTQQEVTDDASICELYQQPVALISSRESNLKVTRPEDLLLAEAYLKAGVV